MYLPSEDGEKGRPDWMLLSFRKPVSASSVKENFLVENIVDEDARTAWVAASNQDEWVQVDLQNSCQIHAIQINYDEYGASQKGLSLMSIKDMYSVHPETVKTGMS